MTKEELAMSLDGAEYGAEISKQAEFAAKQSGLVVVFGYSDDNVELRGAIDEEIGAWEGVTIYFDKTGLLRNKCDDENCPYFAESGENAKSIKAIWCAPGEPAWTYETEIPHATFMINEDDEPFCRGIVFSMADL